MHVFERRVTFSKPLYKGGNMTSFGCMQEPARELIPGWLEDTSIICRKSLTDASAVLILYVAERKY
jgi:hypothetical protein